MKTATPEKIGEHNQKLILDLIRKSGPVSRADISRAVDMSFPSVSANVRVLLENGYVEEVGSGDNVMGRKSTLVAFKANRGYVIGLDIGRSQIRMLLVDLLGATIESVVSDSNLQKSKEEIIEQLKSLLNTLIIRSKIPIEKILCISVGIPGIIDKETGRTYLAPFFGGLQEKDIKKTILSMLNDVPILVENSVGCGAIGEKWRGVGIGFRNILYVNYGIGLGSALIINGELFTGAKGAAGETGFMVLDKTHLRKDFSEEGAIESIISGRSIMNLLNEDNGKITIESLMSNYQNGDKKVKAIVNKSIEYIGMMFINASAVINPDLIIVSGGVGCGIYKHGIDRWNEMLHAHIPYAPKIIESQLQNKANVLGAIAVGLRHINEYVDFDRE